MSNNYQNLNNPYDLMASRYDELFLNSPFYNNTSLKEEEIFYEYVGVATNGETAWDLGCGTGDYSVELAMLGYDTTGIDISSRMLELSRKKADSNNITNVKLLKLDAVHLTELNGTYNLALAYGSFINHLNDIERFFADMSSVLRRGGKFLFSFDNIMGADFFFMLLRDMMSRKNRVQALNSLADTLNSVFSKIRQKNNWAICTSEGTFNIELSYWPTKYIFNKLSKHNFEIEDVQSTNTITCLIPKILMSSIHVENSSDCSRMTEIICALDRKVAKFLNRFGANTIVVCKRI